ncbi:MAG: leucine-rich repeat domain-containing protein [Clostridia bacterium]|nr:leucine-rich repeat domain-containing protein [Clostridia bacterium]
MKRKSLFVLSAAAIGCAALGACVGCDLFGGGGDDKTDGTKGLYYRLTEDDLSYGVELSSDTKGDWDNADIVVPASYKGKPVTEVGGKGFAESGIKSITLPDSIKVIRYGAFEDCKNLKTVKFGSGVTEIEHFAFSSTGLETIEIPATVTKIGTQAFEDNELLTAITVKGNVETENMVFEDCTALKTVEFLGEESLTLGRSVFSDCTALESVTLSADSVTLEDTTFMNCKFKRYAATLETIYKSNFEGTMRTEFPSELVFLRTEEFPDEEISSHKIGKPVSVTLPATLKSVGTNVFYDSSKLTEVVFEGTIAEWCAVEFKNTWSNPLNSGKAQLTIDGNAVEGKLTIPAEVEKVGGYAFYKYTDIRELEILGATEIGQYAFAHNTRLYSAQLPEGMTEIGICAFSDCALVQVTLPESLTDLGSFAFEQNRRLVRIINKSEVDSETIEKAARNASSDLEIITAPDKTEVKKIGDFVFFVEENGSYNLMLYAGNATEITLPAEVNGNKYMIYANAFRGGSLEKITFADTANWFRYMGSSSPAVEIDVTDPVQNAQILQSSSPGYEYYQIFD